MGEADAAARGPRGATEDGLRAEAAEGGRGGFLLLDKPRGLSSFQALHPLKRLFRGRRVGHAGTLDPAASGLLLVGVGAGTRLLEFLEGMPKAYAFEARFGLASDTYDMEGAVTGEPATGLSREAVERALDAFRGRIRQAPPAYSAVKVDGRRAYALARAGETVILEPREVEIHALELLGFADGVASLRMDCSKGTYVRSLVHDLGKALGCGAVADAIRRTAIGPFRLEDAHPVAALAASAPPLLPLETAVAHLPAALLPAHRVPSLRDGRTTAPGHYRLRAGTAGPGRAAAGGLPDGTAPQGPSDAAPAASDADPAIAVPEGAPLRILDPDGRLLAIGVLDAQGNLCPRKVLLGP